MWCLCCWREYDKRYERASARTGCISSTSARRPSLTMLYNSSSFCVCATPPARRRSTSGAPSRWLLQESTPRQPHAHKHAPTPAHPLRSDRSRCTPDAPHCHVRRRRHRAARRLARVLGWHGEDERGVRVGAGVRHWLEMWRARSWQRGALEQRAAPFVRTRTYCTSWKLRARRLGAGASKMWWQRARAPSACPAFHTCPSPRTQSTPTQRISRRVNTKAQTRTVVDSQIARVVLGFVDRAQAGLEGNNRRRSWSTRSTRSCLSRGRGIQPLTRTRRNRGGDQVLAHEPREGQDDSLDIPSDLAVVRVIRLALQHLVVHTCAACKPRYRQECMNAHSCRQPT